MRYRSKDTPKSDKWHCSDPKHPTYAIVQNFVRHLIDVHHTDLQVPDRSADEIVADL